MRHGVPRVVLRGGGEEEVQHTDELVWNASVRLPGATEAGACMSGRWGAPVYWARTDERGRGRVPMWVPKCCNFETVLSARWHALAGVT